MASSPLDRMSSASIDGHEVEVVAACAHAQKPWFGSNRKPAIRTWRSPLNKGLAGCENRVRGVQRRLFQAIGCEEILFSMAQQYVIQARGGATDNGLAVIGTRGEITSELSRFNTSTDGADPSSLHGPGIRIDFPPGEEDDGSPVTQMLLTVNEEEIGWLVLHKIAKEFQWTIVDTSSGRNWSP